MKSKYLKDKNLLVLVLYVLAAMTGIYLLLSIFDSYSYVSSLVEAKRLIISEQLMEVIVYYMNRLMPYIFYSIMFLVAGYIIDTIKKSAVKI